MELSEATGYVKNCIHNSPAPCTCACPFGLDLRSFLKKAARGRWPAAYREFRTAVVFPAVVATLCSRPCQGKCQRSLLGDDPLDLARLEEAVLRLAGSQAPDVFPVPAKDSAIAVIGAGPAGLSLALNMAQKKYPVTVFEAADGWGGALRNHPDFDKFDADFSLQFSAESVDFRYGTSVDSLDSLSGFAAIYIATGKDGSDFGLKSGWDPDSLHTQKTGVFLGGALCDMPLMESIAAGAKLSRAMETVIQTGKVLPESKTISCNPYRLIPDNAESVPHVEPADPLTGYDKNEARAEAARCFQCDCSACLEKCELLRTYHKAPMQMAMEVLADSSPHFLAGRTMTRETYSCNQCGYCGSICPGGVDMGELFRFSREARTKDGIQPAALHEFWLQELDFQNGEGFYASKEPCDELFFPGCQLTALLPQHVISTWELLQQNQSTGIILGCCGAPAVWAGDAERKAANLAKFTSVWEAMGRPRIIAACASCALMLRRQIEGIEVISLYEKLASIDTPAAAAHFDSAAVFNPCAARGDTAAHDGVRKLAERSGCVVESLDDGGKCCGYGGHIRLANPELYRQIADNRAAESEKPYIVYCANCLEVFKSRGKDCAHILDAVFGQCNDVMPTLSQKRRNALNVKGVFMKRIDNEDFVPTTSPWSELQLQISPELRMAMEEKLITDDDIAELIFTAEQNCDYFETEDGLHCASLIRPVIVYWAEYRKLAEGQYEITSAYCHRMHFGEES